MLSGAFRTKPDYLSIAPILDPSPFLKKTAHLLSNHPLLSTCIRRIWFDGYYEANESDMIFGIIHQCKKLEDLLISWTALRHGTVADWSSLFGSNAPGPCIKALEIQARDLPNPSAATKTENHFDNKVLESVGVDFTNLTSLKFSGNSTFMSITDKDLIAISRTANNLRELYMSCFYEPGLGPGPKGIGALVQSSQSGLEVLELHDCFQMDHKSFSNLRLSRLLAQCPLLRRLWLHSVHTCRTIFAYNDIAWSGKVQIGIEAMGSGGSCTPPQPDENTIVVYQVLDQALIPSARWYTVISGL